MSTISPTTIIAAEVLARRRAERERQRQPWDGTILADDEPNQPRAPASPAREKETQR